MSAFTTHLEELRGTRTQKQFAGVLGVPLTTYTNWIAGISTPKMEYIISICETCNVSADWLLGIQQKGKQEVQDLKIDAMKGAIRAILDKF